MSISTPNRPNVQHAKIQKLGGADAAIALAVSARPFEQARNKEPRVVLTV